MRSAPLMLAPLLLAVLLAACGEEAERPASTPPEPVVRYQPPLRRTPPPQAHIQQLPGVDGVIGAETGALVRLFGAPRLDVWEGDARKLQFAGAPCVLDVFLYPAAAGQPPRATYVEARRATDAREVDRTQCIAALRKR